MSVGGVGRVLCVLNQYREWVREDKSRWGVGGTGNPRTDDFICVRMSASVRVCGCVHTCTRPRERVCAGTSVSVQHTALLLSVQIVQQFVYRLTGVRWHSAVPAFVIHLVILAALSKSNKN